MKLKNYNPKEIAVIINGQIIDGFADGTFVKVVRNGDGVTYQKSSTGTGTRVISADNSGTLEITLQQTSPSNAVLDALATADELNGSGITTGMIKDNNGQDLHVSKTLWVRKKPDSEYATELSNKVWILETDDLDTHSLGNLDT